MIRRLSKHVVMRPEELEPLRDAFTVIGVFNPGVAKINDEVALLVRVAEKPRGHRPGFIGLPRLGAGGDVVIDWVRNEELDLIYHGSRRSTRVNEVGAYSAGALLLDRDDPNRICTTAPLTPASEPSNSHDANYWRHSSEHFPVQIKNEHTTEL